MNQIGGLLIGLLGDISGNREISLFQAKKSTNIEKKMARELVSGVGRQ